MKSTFVSLMAAALLGVPAGLAADEIKPRVETDPWACWRNAKVGVLGDSITDKGQCGSQRVYWQYLSGWLGWQEKVYGISGHAWGDIPGQADRMMAEMGDDVDAVFIFIGTNDYCSGVPLGKWYDETEGTVNWWGKDRTLRRRVFNLDRGTVCGRINFSLQRLKQRYPRAQIVLLTPIHRAYFTCSATNVQPAEDWPNTAGLHLEDYVDCVREAGRIWSCPVIDLYAESGLVPLTEEHLQFFRSKTRDGLHPNSEGHLRLAETVYRKLPTIPCGVRAEKPLDKRRLGICLAVPKPGEVDRYCAFIRSRLAKDGFDTLVMRTCYDYRFERHPECANTNAIGRADIEKIVAACRETGIELVPKMNLLGHQGWLNVVKDGVLHAYPEMDESQGKKEIPFNYCRSICPKHPGAQKLVFELMDELADVCGAKTVHVGCDEVFAIGMCPRCAGTPTARLYADWVNGLVRHNRTRGIRTMMWGDRLIDSKKAPYGTWEASDNGTSAALPLMDKDVIVCDWHYEKNPGYPSVELFCDAGLTTWVCPWRSPENARLFVDYAKGHERGNRLAGVLLTTWLSFADVADAIEGKPLRADLKEENAQTLRGIGEVYRLFARF